MDSSQSGISTLGSLYGLDSVVYQNPLETDAHPPTKNHAHAQPPLGFRSSEPRYLELQPLDLARSRSVPSSPSRLHPSELPPPYSSLPPFPPPPSKTQPSSSRPPPDYAQLSFSFTGGATEDHPPPQPSVGPQSTRPPQSARF
ncbi:extensin-like [Penaeus japonicus]|uniref:extensin-like n=1 Tax=Penaeus japonicus TaxID=27405 RepID=UPI001C716A18|nr:extensin-like [Penaeus japonicus]